MQTAEEIEYEQQWPKLDANLFHIGTGFMPVFLEPKKIPNIFSQGMFGLKLSLIFPHETICQVYIPKTCVYELKIKVLDYIKFDGFFFSRLNVL